MSQAPVVTIAKAWRKWLVGYLVLSAIAWLTSRWLGFGMTMASLVCALIAMLFYQRVVNRRSWKSIVWGVHAREK
ncbi:hypothetical protein [Sphingomonas sp. KR3-1]|uniref:hypothetical protein n=1 Tax=Sphingomonas sp. KR3-1 TaxID=3156611 RepID=UPI0032B47155